MSLTDHFPIGQRVRVLANPDPDIATGTVIEHAEETYEVLVEFDGLAGSQWCEAQEVLDECYANLDAWMADSDCEERTGPAGFGWYDENGAAVLDPAAKYAGAIGAE